MSSLTENDEYIPSALRHAADAAFARVDRALAFSMGTKTWDGRPVEQHGPFPAEEDALEIVPQEPDSPVLSSFIVRHNPNGTDDIIWRWKRDRWIRSCEENVKI